MAVLVRVKGKFQVTIPAVIRRKLALQEGCYLEATVSDEGILLRPRQLADKALPPPSLLSYLREPRLASRTQADIDAALQADRDSWQPL
jgi:AbrB family looped-hinge helix DNA binding protein